MSAGHRIEVLDNVLLFLPFSALLYALRPRFSGVLIVTVLFSAGIETAQLALKAGFCQLDDVLNNTAGGLIGLWIAAWISGRRKTGKSRTAMAAKAQCDMMK